MAFECCCIDSDEKDSKTCSLCKKLNQTVGAKRKNAQTTVEDYAAIHLLNKMKDRAK